LRHSLLRNSADHAIGIVQKAGFAAGEGVHHAFCGWLPAQLGVARPEELDAGLLSDVLSAFFHAAGWGTVTVGPLGDAALALDTGDWVEAEPGSAEMPMCFFSVGVVSDILRRLSGEPVAVMEVECRNKNDPRCTIRSGAPGNRYVVYEEVSRG